MAVFRPGKPWIQLRKNFAATQTSGVHTIVWDVSDHDGEWDDPLPADGILTLAKGGLWLVNLNVGRNAIAASSEATCRIQADGSIMTGARSPASTTAIRMSCGFQYYSAEPGGTIEALCQLSSGATATFEVPATNLCISRVGPVRYTS